MVPSLFWSPPRRSELPTSPIKATEWPDQCPGLVSRSGCRRWGFADRPVWHFDFFFFQNWNVQFFLYAVFLRQKKRVVFGGVQNESMKPFKSFIQRRLSLYYRSWVFWWQSFASYPPPLKKNSKTFHQIRSLRTGETILIFFPWSNSCLQPGLLPLWVPSFPYIHPLSVCLQGVCEPDSSTSINQGFGKAQLLA